MRPLAFPSPAGAVRLLLAVLFIALATGCTTLRLGYDSLPTLLNWQMDKYWSLDNQQEALAKARIAELLRWHRANELKQYARLVDGIRERVRAPVDAAEVSRWRDAAEARWQMLSARAAPDLAELMLTLKPEQVSRMKRKLDEANAEFRREHFPADARERQDKRFERVVKRAEWFMGSINEAQRDAIKRHVQVSAAQDEVFLAERLARQQRFVAVVERIAETRPPRAEAQRLVAETLAATWKADPRRAAGAGMLEEGNEQLVATLVNLASDQQKNRLAKKLNGLNSDFVQLAMAD